MTTGELVEIPVIGCTELERLALVCNGDVVLDRVRKDIAATLERELARED